jgi:hypothetical protein
MDQVEAMEEGVARIPRHLLGRALEPFLGRPRDSSCFLHLCLDVPQRRHDRTTSHRPPGKTNPWRRYRPMTTKTLARLRHGLCCSADSQVICRTVSFDQRRRPTGDGQQRPSCRARQPPGAEQGTWERQAQIVTRVSVCEETDFIPKEDNDAS